MGKPKATLQSLRAQEREARKNLIIDAAIHLFGHKAFHEVGMRDIAAQAGISPASIYRYFSDKDGLFVEAFDRECNEIEIRLQKILDGTSARTASEIAGDFVDYLLEHGPFFEMMVHFMINGGIEESALTRFNRTQRRMLEIFDKLFKSVGVKENVRLVSHGFFAALNGVVITFRNYPGRSQQDTRRHMQRLASMIADIFEKGCQAALE